MGPLDSEPIFYYWTPLYSLPAGLLWVVLIVLLLVRSNRNRSAWMVIWPLLFVHVAWLIAKQIIPLPVEATDLLGQIIGSLAMTLALLWLLADRLARRRRVVTFFLALIFMMVWGALGAFCDSGMSISEVSIWITFYGGYEALILLIGLAVTGWWCRKRPSERSFLLWMMWWLMVSAILLLMLFSVIFFLIVFGGEAELILQMAMPTLIAGAISGATLYVIALPFMILAFRHPFYRKRLYDCFRLDWMALPIEQDVSADADQLSSSESD